jgi:hypothetical protein
MRTEAWALQKPNGSFVSSKRIDPTNPIKIALFNTKRHAKVFLEDNAYLTNVEPKKVMIKIVSLNLTGEIMSDFKEAFEDMVNHPPHYKVGGVETIDFMKAKLAPEAFAGFLQGNCIKYLSRAAHKGSPVEDFKKAQWYLNKLIETLDE